MIFLSLEKINFITNLPLNEVSGGWSGINLRLHRELKKRFEIKYIGPINPQSFFLEKAVSKLQRSFGLKGRFQFFSQRRLEKINQIIKNEIDSDASYNFFFGNTPWIQYTSCVPYGVYMDACFGTYLNVFSEPGKFQTKDVKRICDAEKEWLQNARQIFFGSTWAMEETFKQYGFRHPGATVVCTGGNVPEPKEDTFENDYLFLFISLNFEKKGGIECVAAFKKIKEKFPTAELKIIGQKPPEKILQIEGVEYAGLLRKDVPEELNKLTQYISKACFLIHPTMMDTMGAVILEAGYFGCPTIAPNRFGIPDLIINNKTGLLLDVPFLPSDITEMILKILEDKNGYHKMRKEVREFTTKERSWNSIGNKIVEKIKSI